MANFVARITAGATIVDWIDLPGALPSRLNPTTGINHKYYKVPNGGQITVKCALHEGGNENAPDATYGGAFGWEWTETPSRLGGPRISVTPGFTSQARMRLTAGHYLLGIYSATRGALFLHINCE